MKFNQEWLERASKRICFDSTAANEHTLKNRSQSKSVIITT